MIDRKAGYITLAATCQLNAGDAFDDISALLLNEIQEVIDRQNGWKWLTIKNWAVDERYFILSFGFQANALNLIELIVSNYQFDLTANGDLWSEQTERDSLKELRRWLINELGREGKFEWGEAQATYDPRSGYSSISIRYY